MQPAQNWHRQRATDGLDSTRALGGHCDRHTGHAERPGYQHKPNGARLREQTAPSQSCPGDSTCVY